MVDLDHSVASHDRMISELTAAGWRPSTPTIWRSPRGTLHVGPFSAWRTMQRDQKESSMGIRDDQRRTTELVNGFAASQSRAAAFGSASEWNAMEAIFAFVGWLTVRPDAVTLSSHDDAAPIVELMKEFQRRHDLTPPRDGWERAIVPSVERAVDR